jgi:hypothetical protein
LFSCCGHNNLSVENPGQFNLLHGNRAGPADWAFRTIAHVLHCPRGNVALIDIAILPSLSLSSPQPLRLRLLSVGLPLSVFANLPFFFLYNFLRHIILAQFWCETLRT